ncbi:Predicted ATPase [Mycobacteroides abscessus subsp. massiliense]|uniref:AAA family ATPase n=1 Tax=Mycobacteroides abscessus TaxID=36809 RepID=UPI0009A8B52E|nr:AAA family ATPase [Mycobacteroides abscessus]SKK91809.1 Predicted ATPase [Mycobacteroides abscessus subsp. massiliense]
MPIAELTQLRLPAFKSVRNAVIPINELTLILGRNGSGKSNIIDGLAVLSALAEGGDLSPDPPIGCLRGDEFDCAA